MKSVQNRANGKTPRRFSMLRRVVDACQRVLANHTPTGPGSLATGQAAAAGRGGPYVGYSTCEQGEHPERAYPTAMEFALPLRQVFWI